MPQYPFRQRRFATAIVTTSLLLTGAGGTAHAQSRITRPQSKDTLEEVIVTAERRSQNLQKVPISITAINGSQINPAGITDLSDIAFQTPNLNITTFNIGEPSIYIRGIGNGNDSAGADPAVGVFIDEVYLGRPGASSFDLYDLDRIEILRGPQGTLYGKNVTGGTINFYTKKPSQQFEAKAGVTLGNYRQQVYRAYINGPITDKLAAKVAVSRRRHDGYGRNAATGQELENTNNWGGRAQFLFEPSEGNTFLLGLDYSKDDNNGPCRELTELDSPSQPFGGAFIPLEKAAVAGQKPHVCRNTQAAPYQEREIHGVLARADIDVGFATFMSLTAYRKSDLHWLQNLGDPNAPPRLVGVIDSANERAHQFSQELRLTSNGGTSLNWVTGLYFMQEKVDRNESFRTTLIPGSFAAFSGDISFYQANETNSYAAYGQLTWDITSTVSVTAGGRYTVDKKRIDQAAVDNVKDGTPAAIPLGPGTDYAAKADHAWGEFTPRLSINWNITPEQMWYLTLSKGYKSGAYVSQATSANVAATPLDPETVTNIEVGAKTQWFNNRLRVNASVFQMKYEDLQVFQLLSLQLVAGNAKEAKIQGVEAEFTALLTDNLSLSGDFSYLDAKFQNYKLFNPNNGNTTDYSGNRMQAPEKSGSVTANYDYPFNNSATLDFSVIASYKDGYFFSPSNSPRSESNDHTVIDASIKFTAPGARWDLTAWGKNLHDKEYPVHRIFSTFGGSTDLLAPPRTYGVTANYYWR